MTNCYPESFFLSGHLGFTAADLSIFRDGIINGANLVIYGRAVGSLRICLHVEKEDRLYRAEIKLTHLATAINPADVPSEARNEIIEGM